MVPQFLSRKPYHTPVTSASRWSALVSHTHHKMLVVARCVQTTRVELSMRRCRQLQRVAASAKTAWLSTANVCCERECCDRTHTRFEMASPQHHLGSI